MLKSFSRVLRPVFKQQVTRTLSATQPFVYVTRKLPIEVDTVLKDCRFDVWPEERKPTQEEIIENAQGATSLVTLLSEKVDGPLLDALPTLKVVSQVAVGFNNIDVAACTERGIIVTNTPGVLTESTADCAFGLVLSTARRFNEGERMVRAGEFKGWGIMMLLGLELNEHVLGIYGMGRIGQAVARRALGFGMKVVYTDVEPLDDAFLKSQGVNATFVSKEELLKTSDVVSLHCPLMPETVHAIGAPELAMMKKGALLVNTSRGEVVDEGALVDALKSGHIGGAGLDVYEKEPEVHPGLLELDNAILLPHIASATMVTRSKMAHMALSNTMAILNGKPPINPVNKV